MPMHVGCYANQIHAAYIMHVCAHLYWPVHLYGITGLAHDMGISR